MTRPLSAFLLVLCVGSFPIRVDGRQSADILVLSTCPEAAGFLQGEEGASSLINPVLRTREEIDAAVSERRRLLDCLESIGTGIVPPAWFDPVRRNLELFMAFAEARPDEEGARLELVDMAASDDGAVLRLREEVGLAPPPGLVFIRYFDHREDMPPVVATPFESPEVRAVTISSRYVAILVEGASTPASLAETVSHEMVHAFLSAGLDWGGGATGLPSWFQEGMAIHFSRSGRAHVGIDAGLGRVRVAPTSEYERYERVFLYLERQLGTPGFHQAIRRSVYEADPGLLIASAGATSYDALVEDTELWWRWWPVPVSMVRGSNIWLSAAALALLLAALIRTWRRWQPAVPGSSLEVNLNRDLIAAVRGGDRVEARYLLRSGADPNARDADGWPVLLWAVREGSSAIVDLLVEQGAHIGPEVREATRLRDDPDIERVVADGASRQREVW